MESGPSNTFLDDSAFIIDYEKSECIAFPAPLPRKIWISFTFLRRRISPFRTNDTLSAHTSSRALAIRSAVIDSARELTNRRRFSRRCRSLSRDYRCGAIARIILPLGRMWKSNERNERKRTRDRHSPGSCVRLNLSRENVLPTESTCTTGIHFHSLVIDNRPPSRLNASIRGTFF